MCDVYYQKHDEGIQDQILWTADNDFSFCRGKFGVLIDKLTRSGWRCQANTPISSTRRAPAKIYSEMPKLLGGPVSLPAPEQEGTGSSSNNVEDITWEEYEALLAAHELPDDTVTSAENSLYQDYFVYCVNALTNNNHSLKRSTDICSCATDLHVRNGTSVGIMNYLINSDEIYDEHDCDNDDPSDDDETCTFLDEYLWSDGQNLVSCASEVDGE